MHDPKNEQLAVPSTPLGPAAHAGVGSGIPVIPFRGPRTDSPRESRTGVLWWLALGLLLAGGCWLRFHDVSSQILGGDEFHSIRAARDLTLGELFTHYPPAENSIVLSMYARLLLDAGQLTEFTFRLPAMVSGVLLMLVPLLFRRRLGARATLLAVALLATSPFAIYYSFVGRPYGPATLCMLLALLAWQRWSDRPTPRRTATFVVAAALAVFLHALNFFLVGMLVVLSLWNARRGRGPTLRQTLVMSGLLLLAGLALIGPGLPGFIDKRLLDSHRPGKPSLALGWLGFQRIAGEHRGTAVALLTLAVLGARRLVSREGHRAYALVGWFPTIVLGMYITQIFPAQHAWARYMYLGWPVFLMFAGLGFVVALDGCTRWARGRPSRALACVALGGAAVALRAGRPLDFETTPQALLPWAPGLLLLVVGGATVLTALVTRLRATTRDDLLDSVRVPILALLLAGATVAWTPIPLFRFEVDNLRARRASVQLLADRTHHSWRKQVSPFFRKMSNVGNGGTAVLVWPYRDHSEIWSDFAKQQAVHGRPIIAVEERLDSRLEREGVFFEALTDLRSTPSFAWHGARYLVMLQRYLEADQDVQLPVVPAYAERLQRHLAVTFGEPVARDDMAVIYDLRQGWPGAELRMLEGDWEIREDVRDPTSGAVERSERRSVIAMAADGSIGFVQTLDGDWTERARYETEEAHWELSIKGSDGLWRVWVGNFRGDGAVFEGGQLAGDPDSPPDSKILIDKLTPNSFRWTFHVTQDGGHSFDLVQARRHTRATAPPVPELAPAALPDAVPAQSPEG